MNPGLSGVIERGLHFIRSQQRTDGEIASIADHPPARRDLPGPVYVRSPFLSAFVVESLRTLDAPSAQPIIDRIRRFLRAEEEADGRWRFLGRGASIDPDADCTACAAAALGPEAAAARYQTALTRFEDPCGLYSSYVNAEGLRYSWILDGGKVVLGFDRVVNANVARYLGIIGQPCERVWSFLDKELSAGPLEEGSPDYPNPMCFLFMVARAARSSSRLL